MHVTDRQMNRQTTAINALCPTLWGERGHNYDSRNKILSVYDCDPKFRATQLGLCFSDVLVVMLP